MNNNIVILNSHSMDYSPNISHKSSVISDDDHGIEKQIKNLDTANKSPVVMISANENQHNFSLSSN